MLCRSKAQVNNIDRQLSTIRKEERLITESKMNPAQKESKIRALKQREQTILKNIRELRIRAGL